MPDRRLVPIATRPHDAPAGGLGALWSTFKEAAAHPGVLRGTRALLRTNQVAGFDCPGCAWPDPAPGHRTAFEFCENGAKAVAAETTRRRVTPDLFAQWTLAELAGQSDHWLEAQGRLTTPMYRAEGAARYTPIAWDDAFALVARHLNDLASPDEAVFYTSGRTSNEAAFLYQLFARQLGTNNLPDCSNMCHESSGRGLGTTIGIGKGTVTLDDFAAADLILVIGQNPGTNHPRMLVTLEAAAKRGARIVAINPLREAGLLRFAWPQRPLALLGRGTAIATDYLQVRLNGDVALLTGLCKAILAREDAAPGTVLDHAFIAEHTDGFDAFAAPVRAADWATLERESGIPRAEMERVAELYLASRATIACWAMGLTQHHNAVDNIRMVVNLLMLKGNLGRPGAGACPVRGHSNVQGDRTMGIVERPTAAFLDRLGAHFAFTPPRHHGHDTVDAIHALHRGEARVFFALGGNFHSATPDTAYTAEALQRADLTVQVSTKLNRSHLVTGREALILPCLGRTERDVQAGGEQWITVEDSMGEVHASRGHLAPASPDLRSEVAIVAGVARATLGDRSGVDWAGLAADYHRIRAAIEAVIPGFDDYNRRALEPGGFRLPNGARDRVWHTETARARFTAIEVPEMKLESGQYLMMTVRSHDQYNTTIYGLDDRYRGIIGQRRVVMMHPDDIAAAGFVEGQLVDLHSHFDGEVRSAPAFAVVQQALPRGCVCTYFPEANPLVPARSVARESNTPASKSVVVTMTASVSPAG
ncbi:MAG: FdhF/YdeP family oxidoreductase [Myxococcales bacterium]|nr:FdhF/YdeP family oxidoreductase [Myxococcales bacterium]